MFEDNLQQHIEVMQSLTTIAREIFKAEGLINFACLNDHRVFACGNGGSAADAQHFAAELTGRYINDRPAYAGIALTVDTSAMTAIANDYGYEQVFARQLEGLGKKGDVLVAISTSGNSVNVINAVKMAQFNGMKTIALTGYDGGDLADLSDIAIIVPSDNTARIQEAHGFILHTFCQSLEP